MNLSTIPVTPHAIGFIKVACDDDPMFGEPRTRPEFLITKREHDPAATSPDGSKPPRLAAHPLQAELASQEGSDAPAVKEIPIRLYFNKPENAITIRYQAYAVPGNAPVCSGDGKNARRAVRAGDDTLTMQDMPCPGPERCQLVEQNHARCARQVRMAVQVQGQDDPLSVFEVRSSSLNTYRALKAQLQLIYRRFGGLRHVPLKLALWQASNEASGFQAFSLMRLQLDAASEVQAMQHAAKARQELKDAGIEDDVDGIVGGDDEEAVAVASPLDFQAVSEFYQQGGRRAGTEPITVRSVPVTSRVGVGGSAAVADAVRAAAAKQAAAAGAPVQGQAGETDRQNVQAAPT